jgi:hypothetical protein
MTAFTVTTGTPGSPTNTDTLVGRTGGDSLAINGGFVVQDEDSRYGLNATTSCTWAAITPSATLGGSMLFDGRAIWLIPYTGGGGTVPAYNTTISKGSASGKLIGVYSALNVAPTAVGAATPATGYIRVKQWNGTLYGTGALTGITATAAAGESVGWIVPLGQESALALVSSLNQTPSGSYDGSFIKGDWFTVGTTSGSRATTYQIPTNGELVWHGGVWVDRAAATAITAASWSAGVLTVTSTAHGLTTDDRVMIDAILPRTFRTVDSVRCTVVNANTFTVPMTTNPGTYTSGGTVAAQEWWTTTDSLNTKVGATDYQGKHCWLDSTTGLLRFGNDGTTSTGGALPASGLVIRLPNVMTAMANTAAKTVNTLPAALGSRYRFYNGNAGTIRADHMSGTWSPSVFQTGKSVSMSDCAIVNNVTVASQAAACTLTNLGVGGNGNTTNAAVVNVSAMLNPVTMTDCVFSTGEIGARYPVSGSTAYGMTMDRCKLTGTGDRTSAQYCFNMNIGSGLTATRCQLGPHPIATSSQFSNVTIKPFTYYASSYGLPQITVPAYTVILTNLSANWEVSDPTFYGSTPLARNGMVSTASGSDNLKMRNWGSYASPIDMRLNGLQIGKAWTRVTTTATVTETAHPYRVGDQVAVFMSSAGSTITQAVKTITAVTTNTFDFACVNTGATSGTISYFVGNMTGFITLGGSSNATIQNCHVRGNTTNAISSSSSSYGAVIDNVTTEPALYASLPAIAANNMQARSLYEPDYPVASAASAIFGTHFSDVFVREPGTAVPGQAAAVTGVAWTRTTTVCTVTSPNHGLLGNLERIWVENSSSTAAVANGWGASGITVVPLDKDTFQFTCLNAGSASGTLDYWLSGDSQFRVIMSEASSLTTSQAQITVNAGAAGFTGAGTIVLPAVGDQATWETPAFILGYDSFAHTPAIPYGTGVTALSTAQQFNIEYALDRGAGFGSYRNAAYHRTGGGGSSGSTNVTMTDTTGVQVNDYIMGTGIATGAKVQSITNSTTIVATVANAATVSGTLTFWYGPNETTFPSTGVKFRVRMTANTASTTTAPWQIDLPLLSSTTSRARLYDQRTQYTLTFTNLVAGSDIRILTNGTVTSLLDVDSNAGTTYAYTYFYAAGTQVDIQVLKDGYKPYRYQGYTLGAANANFLVTQQAAIDEGT